MELGVFDGVAWEHLERSESWSELMQVVGLAVWVRVVCASQFLMSNPRSRSPQQRVPPKQNS